MEPAGGCLETKISAFFVGLRWSCGLLFLDSRGGFFANWARGGE